MNELKMKAKAGVTLVELLVVILIVTILSVSLLPLLKPYIEEAKYAAEPIPVLANIQTKINLYQYEKDRLPGYCVTQDVTSVATWMRAVTNNVVSYVPAVETIPNGNVSDSLGSFTHFASQIDVDWQDLLGRRMHPGQFKYAVLKGDGSATYGYVLGVFGDGNGLGRGTGYAVMSIVDTSANRQVKIVGTWRRYKPKADKQLSFEVASSNPNEKMATACLIPSYSEAFTDGVDALVTALKAYGWEFNEEAITAAP